MEDRQLFINGESVDFFSDDEPIPLILQVNTLGNLTSLQGNGSKQFKLPLTQNNRRILGFPDDVAFCDNTPYEQLPAKFIEEGIEIVSNGLIEIQDVQDDYVEVLLLFGNIDILDQLGFQLYDMGDSTSQATGYGASLIWNKYSLPYSNDPTNLANCVWDVAHAAYSQKKTDGWIWPVVDYGDIDRIPPYSGLLNVRNMRPALFLHSVIETLIASAGYTIDYNNSCLYNDPKYYNLYSKLLSQFSNSDFEHSTDVQNTPDNLSLLNNYNTVQQMVGPYGPTSGQVNFAQETYTATQNIDGTVTVEFDLYLKGHPGSTVANGSGTGFTIAINIQTPASPGVAASNANVATMPFDLSAAYTKVGTGDGADLIGEYTFFNNKLSFDAELVEGMVVNINFTTNIHAISVTTWIIKQGASFNFVSSEQLVLWEQNIQVERILPDVGQLDMLKCVLQMFGLIFISNPNTGTVIFTSFKVINNNRAIAKDWTDKCLAMGKQISYQIGNYSQVNKLQYQQDSTIPVTYMPLYYADDVININDKTLNPTQIQQPLFTSIFAPSLNRAYIGGTIAQMSDPTGTDAYSSPGSPRILIDQKYIMKAGESVTFADNDTPYETVAENVVINDVISTPYFYKTDAPDLGGGAAQHLAWKDLPGPNGTTLAGLRSTYYQEMQSILTNSKLLTRYFYLTPADIANYDFTIPIYLQKDGAYFYVSKIDSWVKNKPVKVDLIRL